MMFRKKPVVIEAVQWTGSNVDEVVQHCTSGHWESDPFEGLPTEHAMFVIPTLEGVMIASVGDWIIRGVKGEFYPCKPDIFEATYEAVDDEGGQ